MITQLGINNLFCFDYCVNSGFPNSLYNFTTFSPVNKVQKTPTPGKKWCQAENLPMTSTILQD